METCLMVFKFAIASLADPDAKVQMREHLDSCQNCNDFLKKLEYVVQRSDKSVQCPECDESLRVVQYHFTGIYKAQCRKCNVSLYETDGRVWA